MDSKQVYMRFLTILQALEGHEGIPAMDLDAKKLLEVIAVRYEQKKAAHRYRSDGAFTHRLSRHDSPQTRPTA